MSGYILALVFFVAWQWEVRNLMRHSDRMLGRIEVMESFVKRMDERA